MNYSVELNRILEAAKADKSITQPFRNYGMKKLQEAKADFSYGKSLTRLEAPQGLVNFESHDVPTLDEKRAVGTSKSLTDPIASTCACPIGGKHINCPMHGASA